ncbi:MAG TPA: polymer-forming cytoskeletal protein [Hyphomicrobium sp.]|jgi:cytoskeletal protein CcmA (bactofilin family)
MADIWSKRDRSSKGTVVINRGVTIVGSLSLEGQVFIEGTVDGEVWCTGLEIDTRGIVDGLIVAERVVVLGEFRGHIYASELIMRTGCAVEGQIFHNKLVLEEGCYFEGKSRRHANPRQLAPAAQGRAPMSEQLDERMAYADSAA